jgi:glycogen synthase
VMPKLTVIGSGPDEPQLRAQTDRLHLTSQVEFVGPKSGEELVQLLNQHRVLVVPSRWNEPFGIVALEGIACGCFVIGSSGGGLPEAIGPCGVTFENGDVGMLADRLQSVLREPTSSQLTAEESNRHLAAHTSREVAQAYERVIHTTLTAAP